MSYRSFGLLTQFETADIYHCFSMINFLILQLIEEINGMLSVTFYDF